MTVPGKVFCNECAFGREIRGLGGEYKWACINRKVREDASNALVVPHVPLPAANKNNACGLWRSIPPPRLPAKALTFLDRLLGKKPAPPSGTGGEVSLAEE